MVISVLQGFTIQFFEVHSSNERLSSTSQIIYTHCMQISPAITIVYDATVDSANLTEWTIKNSNLTSAQRCGHRIGNVLIVATAMVLKWSKRCPP